MIKLAFPGSFERCFAPIRGVLRALVMASLFAVPASLLVRAQTESYFPQAIRGDARSTTRVLLQNPGDAPGTATVEFFDQNGQRQEIRNAELQPNGSEEIVLGGAGVPTTVGSAAVKSSRTVLATGFYALEVGTYPLPPVGLLPVTKARSWRGFATVSSSVDTGLALANPTSDPANCQITAYTGPAGQPVGSAVFSLEARRQSARFLRQFITDLPPAYQGGFSLECDREVVPVALTQRRRDGAIAAVAMDSSKGSRVVYFPQAIRGNSENTIRILVQNASDRPAAVTVQFYDQNGLLRETRNAQLQPDGSDAIALGGTGVPTTVGWAVVTSDQKVLTTGFYSLQVAGQSLPQVGVLPVAKARSWRGFATVSSTVNTGLAVANPGPKNVNCQIAAHTGPGGQVVGTEDFALGTGQQTAQFLPQLVSSLPPVFQGEFSLSCDQEIVPVALVQRKGDGAISALAMPSHIEPSTHHYAQIGLLSAPPEIASLALSPDGSIVAYGSYGQNTIDLVDLSNSQQIRTLSGHTQPVTSLAFSPDGQILASTGTVFLPPERDGFVRLWRVATGAEMAAVDTGASGTSELRFSQDGELLSGPSGGSPLQTVVWRADTLEPVQTVEGVFRTAAFSPDTSRLAGAARDEYLHVMDLSDGSEVMEMSGHNGWVTATAYDRSGKFIASGGDDQTIRLWDAETGNLLRTLNGHESSPEVVVYSPDGRILASLGSGVKITRTSGGVTLTFIDRDRVLRLWDTESGSLLATVNVGSDLLTAFAFSFDWEYLVTAADNGNIRVFQR